MEEGIQSENQIFITLWHLGGIDTLQKLADRFGVSQSTVFVCRDGIISGLIRIRIKTSLNVQTWWKTQAVEQGFWKQSGFPGIIGAVDGNIYRWRHPVAMSTGSIFIPYNCSMCVDTIQCILNSWKCPWLYSYPVVWVLGKWYRYSKQCVVCIEKK